MTDIDGRILGEFVAGADVPDIAQRYAVPEAYVDRVIEETSLVKPKRRFDASLNPWPNRLFYSLVAGTVINFATGIYALGTAIAVVLFVLTTAIVVTARRN
jgi:tetrahydromethanopterin S-methyltransferase subunit B